MESKLGIFIGILKIVAAFCMMMTIMFFTNNENSLKSMANGLMTWLSHQLIYLFFLFFSFWQAVHSV